jgi:hypothetical protein
MSSSRWMSTWLCAAALALCPAVTRADARPGDVFAYDLRLALQPLAFQGGVTQRWFGSSARVEYSPLRWLDVMLDGRVSWLSANADNHTINYWARAGFAFHISESVKEEKLYGTVYPADVPAISPPSIGSDQDWRDLPVSEKLRGGELRPLDVDKTVAAIMRDVHALRVALAYTRITEHALPSENTWMRNRMALLQLGYSYSTHWNIPESVSGKREVGYRRFYGDLMLTTEGLTKSTPAMKPAGTVQFVPIGARVGMQGLLAGLLESAPSLGLAYDLELGMAPGRSGYEAYLFVALGLGFDVATR